MITINWPDSNKTPVLINNIQTVLYQSKLSILFITILLNKQCFAKRKIFVFDIVHLVS